MRQATGSVVDRVWQHPQMTTATIPGGRNGEAEIRGTVGSASLAYCFSQRCQVVRRRLGLDEFTIVTHDVPASWSGQPKRMPLAQVVRVRLAIGGQGAHHGSGVSVDEGKRGNRRACAPGLRAPPRAAHGRTIARGGPPNVAGARRTTLTVHSRRSLNR